MDSIGVAQMSRLSKFSTASNEFTLERFQLQVDIVYMSSYTLTRCKGLATARTGVGRFQLQMETVYMIVYPRTRCEGLATTKTWESLLFEWFQLRMEMSKCSCKPQLDPKDLPQRGHGSLCFGVVVLEIEVSLNG